MRRRFAVTAVSLFAAGWAFAQETPTVRDLSNDASKPSLKNKDAATRPTTSPATAPADPRALSADQMLGQMLNRPASREARALPPPVDLATDDRTSGSGAVRPAAPAVPTLREGTIVVDRVGRLSKSLEGTQSELIFEADGKAMRDPPMVIVPNVKLMAMENAVLGANKDLRFRVSGTVTEYRGRNYILLEKVLVVPDTIQQF